MKYELYKRYTLNIPIGIISDSGIDWINQYIAAQQIYTDESWTQKNPNNNRHYLPPLPISWVWQWQVTGKGEYVGSFTKRVSKYYWKEYKLKCPTVFLQTIGNMAKQHSQGNDTYHFDIVDSINWQDGDFGDDGSCYWGNHSNARAMLTDNGGLAIRFFDGQDSDRGIGRAWLVPIADDNAYILFNGYGFDTSSATLTITRVFSQFMGLNYKRIELSNNGHAYSILYINGGIGYIAGDSDTIERYRFYDLNFDDSNGDYCYECNDYIHEDSVNYGADDNVYCDSCYESLFSSCDHCYETHYIRSIQYVVSTHYYVCEDCLDSRYSLCEHCETQHLNDNMREIDNHELCPDCLAQETLFCIQCNQLRYRANCENGICSDCQK